MSVIVKHGIGYSDRTEALFIDMAAAKNFEPARPADQTIPFEKYGAALPWSPWGNNNLLPQEMIVDIETTGILNSIIEGKARFANSQGMVPAICKSNEKGERIIEKILDGTEVNDFIDQNNAFWQVFAWMKDYIAFHRIVGRVLLNSKRDKIVAFQRDDISEMRLSKKDNHGLIRTAYFSGQWEKCRQPEAVDFSAPLLNPMRPYLDLKKQMEGGSRRTSFAFTAAHPSWGKHYYPTPLWFAAYKWVKIAQAVPEMKAAMYENSIRAKFVVVIHEEYWEKAFPGEWDKYTPEKKLDKKSAVYDDIEKFLVGAKNAGKAIFTTGYRDRDGKTWAEIEFKPIEDSTKQGEYLPDSAAANSEIAFASLFNPAIIGASLPSGPYTNSQGGSNIRESVLVQIVLHELERQQVRSLMNVIKYFNGWDKTFPGLEFIIPATILTTLDTGAGSKQVNTGTEKPKDNGTN
jgi:hypothetical protein